jgi:mRNA interferase MazF
MIQKPKAVRHAVPLQKGEIWLANLNPSRGTESGKTRPVLILQDQALLDVYHPSTLIVPLTTHLIENAYPLRVRINAQDSLDKDSDILVDQIRAIDNKRLVHGPLTIVTQDQLTFIYQAIDEVMGVVRRRT